MHEKRRILLAEDDLNLGQVLSEYLTLKGFDVVLCRDGAAAWDGFQKCPPDLFILDVMMPRQDGFTLARRIREVDATVPIIFLTAKNLQEDRIEGFTIGGDDYLTKPFSMQELMLRMQAILRRLEGVAPTNEIPRVLHIGRMRFDPSSRKLDLNGSTISLTNKEARLLQLLAHNKNKTLARTEALRQIWGEDNYYNARSMDVYITRLRKILKAEEGLHILTVHGEGFRLIEGDAGQYNAEFRVPNAE